MRDSINELILSLDDTSIKHRKLIAEIVLIRLFLLTENTVESVCSKLLCGADYLDGTGPRNTVAATSKTSARKMMRQNGRQKVKPYLKWTNAADIRDNLQYTIQIQNIDPVFNVITNHETRLNEMRYIRNHIAHRSQATLLKFREIIKQYYGGLKHGMTPGVLLLTPAIGPPNLLKQYLIFNRIFIKDLVRV